MKLPRTSSLIRSLTLALVMLGCYGLSIASARAATYYVAKDEGSDSWDGLAPSHEGGTRGPWSSLQRINYHGWFSPGSTILLKRGKNWEKPWATIVNGSGAPGSENIIGAYGSGPNPKITGTNNRYDGSIGIYMTQPDYWIIQDIDFHNQYRAINIMLNTAGHNNFTVQRCNFSNDVAYAEYIPGVWPTPAATGIYIAGSGLPQGTVALTGVTIDNCHFTRMGGSIGIGNYGHNGSKALIKKTVISNCTMQDGSFIQIGAVGAHDFKVLNTKIWNNGMNIGNGPASFSFYGAPWDGPTDLVVEDSEIGFSSVCDATGCSPSDGEGIEFGAVDKATFRRVLFHHNDATAVLIGGNWPNELVFENCVFAANEAYDVNGRYGCEPYGEFRLHFQMTATFNGCRFLPRSSLPWIPERPFVVSEVHDIPPVQRWQDDDGPGGNDPYCLSESPSGITFSNTTTHQYGQEVLGPNLAATDMSTWTYTESGYQIWQYWFFYPKAINTVKLTETPNAGITKFVVQYWDWNAYAWKDLYTGKGIGTSDYDRYLPFPLTETQDLRVVILATNSPWMLGLDGFEIYKAN